MTEGNAARGMELLRHSGLMRILLPEVEALIGCDQPANYHPEGDVYRHTMLMLSMLEYRCTETLAFGVLFHDIAKPPCREVKGEKMTFYGHTERGAEMATGYLAAAAALALRAGPSRLPGALPSAPDRRAQDAPIDA